MSQKAPNSGTAAPEQPGAVDWEEESPVQQTSGCSCGRAMMQL
jgi:hypothetical protein